MKPIEGTVTYRERMMLPPGSYLEVQLQDISIADAPAQVLATLEQPLQGGPPYTFALDFDQAAVVPRHTYSLRATIRRGDALLFTSTEYIDPFAGPAEITLTRVAPPPRETPADPLTDNSWRFVELLGEVVPDTVNGKAVSLQFNAEQRRAAGYSGCNRYTGVFSRNGRANDGAPLTFGAMAGTRMACAEGMEIESRINELFGAVSAFRMEGDDIVAEVPVRFSEAVTGATIEVPTLDGKVRMRIPPGSQSGRVFRLKGKGLTNPSGRGRGDQRVAITVEVPTYVTPEQQKLLDRFTELEQAHNRSPLVRDYVNRLDDYYS